MKRRIKIFSLAMTAVMLYQLCFPVMAYALTGGPSQPEVESFEPVGTSEMVDVFSGDFTYNIPLLDVDGYPVNIAYNSGVTMDQEASWVGLGWNINPGVINRNMRGLPDDFNGDEVSRIQYVKPNRTFGLDVGMDLEAFGAKMKWKKLVALAKKYGVSLDVSLGINYNNYTGLGIESKIIPAISAGNLFKGHYLRRIGFNAKLELSSSSKDGFTMKPKLGMSINKNNSNLKTTSMGTEMSVSTVISSKEGVKKLTFANKLSVNSVKTKATPVTKENNGEIETEWKKQDYGGGGSLNGSSSISFGTQTYQPAISSEMSNLSFSFSFSPQSENLGITPGTTISGYFSGQRIKEVKAKRGAYGNLYSHKAQAPTDMIDFNREKEGSFSDKNPVLALPIYTYDVFSASGQGVSGVFKPTRNDIPVVHDPEMMSNTVGSVTDFELGLGSGYKAGLDPSLNFTKITGGAWKDDNDLLKKVGYTNSVANELLYEPVYFKNAGEKTKVNTNSLHFAALANGPVKPKLVKQNKNNIISQDAITSETQILDGYNNNVSIADYSRAKGKRDKRNVLFNHLTNGEIAFGFNPKIDYYALRNSAGAIISASGSGDGVLKQANRDIANKPDHIAEIAVTRPDGARYVYGIPAYNNFQHEVSFTFAKNKMETDAPTITPNCATGQVSYAGNGIDNLTNPSEDNIKDRKNKGIDHAYNVTHTPAYAHSYLLTDVLSADYIDVTGNGVSGDDYGNYTKIQYYRASTNYKWRVPYNDKMANFNEGLKSDNTDDNANVIYGEKEIWHVARIEGKNHYAIFYLSEREDGLGVLGEHGGKDAQSRSYKLDKIELYARAIPGHLVKTVHFEYDYSLCPEVDNNTDAVVNISNPLGGTTNINAAKGKLTLKKIYFTYGKSSKGKFSAYEFKYNTINPKYNLKAYDRWGNYKPNNLYEGANANCDRLSNAEFPYVNQDKTTADQYASAWSLDEILLPSGGKINVQYEADDYAYVQDKQAMQMATIRGFADYSSWSETTPIGSISLNENLYDAKDPKECIFFDLPQSTASLSPTEIRNSLLYHQNGLLYYNCLVNLNKNEADPNYEYIRGYAEIADAGVVNLGGNNPVGWIKVKLKKDDSQHPIALTAWQYARMYLPQIVNAGSNLRKDADAAAISGAFIRGIFGFIVDAIEMIDGMNDKLRRNGFGQRVNVQKSWIRINNLTGFKYGGGCRVKRLTIADNWQNMAGSSAGVTMTYGQEYDYTTFDVYCGEKRVISSGVASYEPDLGGDENPWKKPWAYTIDNAGVPNDEFYVEEPFGESFFPSPSVGYSRVSVKNIIPANASAHGTGKTVHLYYTAKDFPVLTAQTDLEAKSYKSSPLFNLLGYYMEENMTMSQGFQIELNDMHGKPAGTLNYSQAFIDSYDDEKAYSGMKYHYAVEDENAKNKKLSNNFLVVNPNNTIETATVGVEVDMVMDTRKQASRSFSGTAELNLDVFIIPLVPPIISTTFTGFGSASHEITSYKSAVMLRVVNRYGLLKSTEAFEEGSHIRTENILLDAETGETLLTRTYNEYDDPVFNFTMPAHWAYDGMGQAYKNVGATLDLVADNTNSTCFRLNSGSGNGIDPVDYLADGDVLGVVYESSGLLATYLGAKVHAQFHNDKWFLLDKTGEVVSIPVGGRVTVKVIQSGRKNMQAVPIMQITSLAAPLTSNGNALLLDESKQVLNASAVSYKNKWAIPTWHTEACGDENMRYEILNVINYMLATGQITTSIYNSYIGPNDNTPLLPISTTASGAEVYNNSMLKQYMQNAGGVRTFNPEVHTNATHPNQSQKYGFVFKGPDNFSASAYFYTTGHAIASGEGDINTLSSSLLFAYGVDENSMEDLTNNIMPTSIDLLSLIDNDKAMVKVNYIIDNLPQSKNVVMHFTLPTTTPLFCKCLEVIGGMNNPFMSGVKGNWRKQKDWLYYGERNNISATTNLRKDGTYKTFASFWGYEDNKWVEKPANWTNTNEVTKYHPNGYELENRDALNKYSAALYSTWRFNSPIAVANNCNYNQLVSESVEEITGGYCPEKPLWFQNEDMYKTSEQAHSGKLSFKLAADQSMIAENSLSSYSGLADDGVAGNRVGYNYLHGKFKPTPGKYIISTWVKVKGTGLERVFTYNQSSTSTRILISATGGTTPFSITAYPKGPIINGWQKIEQEFTVNAGNTNLMIELRPDNTTGRLTYIDDLRIHPYDASMKTFVYDIATQRLQAELDENNYATFYEYNAEGQLVRVKKETEKGIVTLKEVRNNQRKIYPAQ